MVGTLFDKIKCREEQDLPFFSLEYFPPRTKAGAVNLFSRFDRMAAGDPLFIDITWGAGGGDPCHNDFTGSLAVASTALNYCGLVTMLHLTCVNSTKDEMRAILQKAKDCGIKNVMALRGDYPDGTSCHDPQVSDFKYAVDLVRFIKKEFGDYFGICVAGYPNGHPECVSFDKDLQYLKEKIDAGADFIISQLFFETETFINFVKRCREIGINCPIIPGVLPIQSYASIRHLMKLSKLRLPEKMYKTLEAMKDDDDAIREFGIKYATDMCRELLDSKLTYGIHFYTLNREVAVKEILVSLGMWNSQGTCSKDVPWLTSANEKRSKEGIRPIFWSARPKSYLMRTKDWDEFPNGRWGDSSSPAFGSLGEYYLFKTTTGADKTHNRKMWGEKLETISDVCKVFIKYLDGKISRLPWSEDSALAPETKKIKEKLFFLNQNGILTTNSQPAVNGVSSTDPIHGWGSAGGYVYQKAYLEFFLSPELFFKLLEILANYKTFCYHALNLAGESYTNDDSGAVNAVTWGVFPQKEIIQPTVVDPESFPIWKDEAFELWKEWECLYEEGSSSQQLINNIYNTYFLVNVVENDYIGGNVFAPFEELFDKK